ncbi:MAG: phage virion morphogenesis protein [Pseudomonadota bacterium]
MTKDNLNTAEMDAAFALLRKRLSDLAPVMEDVGEYMVESTKQNFRDGSSPIGSKWLPKSQATLDAYAARKETVSTSPLIGPSKALSTTIFAQHDSRSVVWGSALIYAAVQQYGAEKGEFGTDPRGVSIPWGDIPARPFIGMSSDDESAILDVIEEYLDQADGAS